VAPDLPQRRLKVAVLNRVFSVTGGGAERYAVAIVEQLADRHEIHVFAQEINHQWPGVTYHRIACAFKKPRWLNQLWYAYATWRATRQGFDIVHSHENVWHGNVQTMHVKTVKRSLFNNRQGVSLSLSWLRVVLSPRLLTYLYLERKRLNGRSGCIVVAASQALAVELEQEFSHIRLYLRVITPGVYFPEKKINRYDARVAMAVKEAGGLILFVANDYTRKGLPTLLYALSLLPTDVRLLVVGNAKQIPRHFAKACELNISHRVDFIGSLSDMRLAYCAADLLAHPTLEDSFGMVVLEAMANSLPVVVSSAAYCGISAMLDTGAQAILLEDPLDAGNLAAVISTLLNDAAYRNGLIQNGLQFARLHSWSQAAASYNDVYQEAAKHN
jgi:glycosyltransferase involved in cell wall biosynthesis